MSKLCTFLVTVTLLPIITIAATTWTSEYIQVVATAYCPGPCCTGTFSDNRTATNTDALKGGVAVDPSVIPLGSYLDIPGYNRGPNHNGSWIKADDTGRLIKGNKIDVRFKTHKEAQAWGVRKIKVRVWRKR